MLYKNLNPILNSDIIEKAGFAFDGYYYVNPQCPVKLNKVESGYAITFIDPAGPQINETINSYCDLISLMTQSLQMVIEKELQGKGFADAKEQLSFIGTVVKNYLKFDKSLNFIVMRSPAGLQIRPNNEYTFTIASGDIRKFRVNYNIAHTTIDETNALSNHSMEIEVSAQCISWPFLMDCISESHEGFNKESDELTIVSVTLINEDKEIPFFGMGIPTIHGKSEG